MVEPPAVGNVLDEIVKLRHRVDKLEQALIQVMRVLEAAPQADMSLTQLMEALWPKPKRKRRR